ncbi:MAG: hypothetical protein WKG07_32910 [Hymenobacter sp.]
MKTKKIINEPDFIGGQGPLTKEEETALNAYFTKNKKRTSRDKKESIQKIAA